MAFDLDEEELRATRKINKADRNEIEVNEYVRTNKGYITKMSSEQFIKIMLEGKSVFGKALKHSKNIIDLVEVGDYVNGNKVLAKERTIGIGVDTRVYLLLGNAKIIHNEDIKTIITKEQMASIEYKVESEEK